MSKPGVIAGDNGLALSGDLDKHSVPQVLNQLTGLITAGNDTLRLDLSKVSRADSAGIALLLQCMRRARQLGRDIRFAHIPDQMMAIARVSGLGQVLPLDDD